MQLNDEKPLVRHSGLIRLDMEHVKKAADDAPTPYLYARTEEYVTKDEVWRSKREHEDMMRDEVWKLIKPYLHYDELVSPVAGKPDASQ